MDLGVEAKLEVVEMAMLTRGSPMEDVEAEGEPLQEEEEEEVEAVVEADPIMGVIGVERIHGEASRMIIKWLVWKTWNSLSVEVALPR